MSQREGWDVVLHFRDGDSADLITVHGDTADQARATAQRMVDEGWVDSPDTCRVGQAEPRYVEPLWGYDDDHHAQTKSA